MHFNGLALSVFTLVFSVAARDLRQDAIAEKNCKEVSFTVYGNAVGKNITGVDLNVPVDVLVAAVDETPNITISGTEIIAGTYCTPTKDGSNNEKIQILFGSLTTNRGAWNALGGLGTKHKPYKPEIHSWTRYANAQGYATLAIDRLGTGKSSHPDPINKAQAPYEIELYADLARQVRQGHNPDVPKYIHVIYVGNSYGGQLGAGIAGARPEAYDELILTGFTDSPRPGLVGFALTNCLPAAQLDPIHFGDQSLGYLTTESKIGRTNSWFGSHDQILFDDQMADYFYERRDLVAVGQFMSVYYFPYTGGNFTGRVLNLIGEHDQPFCGYGSPVFGPAFCGSLPKDTGVHFPQAEYNWKSVAKVGHIVQLHTRAPKVYEFAHRWLGGESFNDAEKWVEDSMSKEL